MSFLNGEKFGQCSVIKKTENTKLLASRGGLIYHNSRLLITRFISLLDHTRHSCTYPPAIKSLIKTLKKISVKLHFDNCFT